MRHFNYFENGGPAPSSCLSCGRNNQLFDLGRELQFGGMAQLCSTCVKELAVFIGYAEEAPLREKIYNLECDVEAHEIELAKVPDLVDGLFNGIRSSVTDFIFAVSYDAHVRSDSDVQDDNGVVDEPSSDGASAGENSPAPVKSARK
jgi:hypothetical protein